MGRRHRTEPGPPGPRVPRGERHVSPDGRLLATAAIFAKKDDISRPDRVVRLWEVATGAPRTLTGHEDTVCDVAFSPNGKRLASASMDFTVRLWDLGTGSSRVLSGHEGLISAVAFSPDGSKLASSSEDGSTRVWDLADGGTRVFRVGDGWSQSVAFSHDERTLLTDGWLWDVASGESRKLAQIRKAAFAPDGRTLGMVTDAGEVRLWRDDLPHEPRALQAWLKQATDYEIGSSGEPRGEQAGRDR